MECDSPGSDMIQAEKLRERVDEDKSGSLLIMINLSRSMKFLRGSATFFLREHLWTTEGAPIHGSSEQQAIASEQPATFISAPPAWQHSLSLALQVQENLMAASPPAYTESIQQANVHRRYKLNVFLRTVRNLQGEKKTSFLVANGYTFLFRYLFLAENHQEGSCDWSNSIFAVLQSHLCLADCSQSLTHARGS